MATRILEILQVQGLRLQLRWRAERGRHDHTLNDLSSARIISSAAAPQGSPASSAGAAGTSVRLGSTKLGCTACLAAPAASTRYSPAGCCQCQNTTASANCSAGRCTPWPSPRRPRAPSHAAGSCSGWPWPRPRCRTAGRGPRSWSACSRRAARGLPRRRRAPPPQSSAVSNVPNHRRTRWQM